MITNILKAGNNIGRQAFTQSLTIRKMATTRENPTDVLILGAGPAGLSVAIALARLLHPCIVLSSSEFRNERSKHLHGLPTWEHRHPADFREAAKKDILAHYDTVTFQEATITKVVKMARNDGTSLFKVIDKHGSEWWGRKLSLATGITDVPLDIEGYEECWATGIFHCLFCHGYEERGAASAGVLAIDDCAPPLMAIHLTRMALRLASKITIYTNGDEEVTKGIQELLAKEKPTSKTTQNVTVDSRKIAKFIKGANKAEVEVVLGDGERKVEGFLAYKPKSQLNGDWVQQLGLETTEQGDIKLNFPFNETSQPGVFASGDCGTVFKAIVPGMAQGGLCAAGMIAQITAED